MNPSLHTAAGAQIAAALDRATTHLARCPACSRRRALVAPDAVCQEGARLVRACEEATRQARQEDM